MSLLSITENNLSIFRGHRLNLPLIDVLIVSGIILFLMPPMIVMFFAKAKISDCFRWLASGLFLTGFVSLSLPLLRFSLALRQLEVKWLIIHSKLWLGKLYRFSLLYNKKTRLFIALA
ncbi:hypothetical protein ACJX0J_013566, partial [Zea mays]